MTNRAPQPRRMIVNGHVSPVSFAAPRSAGAVRLLPERTTRDLIACTVPPHFNGAPEDTFLRHALGIHELECAHGYTARVMRDDRGHFTIYCYHCADLGHLDLLTPLCGICQRQSRRNYRREGAAAYARWQTKRNAEATS